MQTSACQNVIEVAENEYRLSNGAEDDAAAKGKVVAEHTAEVNGGGHAEDGEYADRTTGSSMEATDLSRDSGTYTTAKRRSQYCRRNEQDLERLHLRFLGRRRSFRDNAASKEESFDFQQSSAPPVPVDDFDIGGDDGTDGVVTVTVMMIMGEKKGGLKGGHHSFTLTTSSLLPKDSIFNMDQIQSDNFQQQSQTLTAEHKDSVMEDAQESLFDSVVCDPSSRLVPTGFTRPENSGEDYVMFVNAGEEATNEADGGLTFLGDTFFDGGSVMRTNEQIVEGGDYPFIYQSARLGNFCYRFDSLPPGDYVVDLHFVEIINTNGPKGMRVFNVLSELDIFAAVGANKPLQLIDLRVSVKDNGVILIRFESINGSPVISGICIRKPEKPSASQVTNDYIKCNYCAAQIEIPVSQMKIMQTKSTEKYENKIKELTMQCELKGKECYEAWMSLTATNKQLEAVQMELDNVTFKSLTTGYDNHSVRRGLDVTELPYGRDSGKGVRSNDASVNHGIGEGAVKGSE
ncbi:hypothetical protein PIB30_045936 [Stylosanthes scabra]|uniref:Malectin domain-containing protein n=1 Tax=Stylosanthes scabra TaxID=79078 RepID=A0ABU6ZF19_9FABA|nr:hypothetical protein [Stylosanthes scabra]